MTHTEYQTAPAAPYNGHPSFDHWNVALWFTNTETWYRLARTFPDADAFADALTRADAFNETPDGVTITYELAAYAWECCTDE